MPPFCSWHFLSLPDKRQPALTSPKLNFGSICPYFHPDFLFLSNFCLVLALRILRRPHLIGRAASRLLPTWVSHEYHSFSRRFLVPISSSKKTFPPLPTYCYSAQQGWAEPRGSLSGQRAGGGSDSRGRDRGIGSGRESARPGGRHGEQRVPGHRVRLGVRQNGSGRLRDSRVTSVRQKKLQDVTDI